MESQTISSTFHLGNQVTQCLFAFHLFFQVFAFDEVGHLGVTMTISSLVQLQKVTMNSTFHLQGLLHSLQSRIPFLTFWFGHVLENYASSTLVLVLHKLHGVFAFFLGVCAVLLGEAMKSHVIPVEVASHCHVGVAGKQFQVDLLVDHSFGVGVEIQPDLGRHLAFFSFLGFLVYERVKFGFKLGVCVKGCFWFE